MASSWSFGIGFPRDIVKFVVDNRSSTHTDNSLNFFLVLVKGPSNNTNDSVGTADTKFTTKVKI